MVNLFYLDHDPKKCAQYYCDKHVNKIMIEISQILSQIHHKIGTKTPPYKLCSGISDNLAPFKWASTSIGNYNYCAKLAKCLLNEYRHRYGNKEHKCENAINWHLENVPEGIKRKNKTKFLLTENVKIYTKYFKDPVLASRIMYVDFKCKNDKWTNRDPPLWFDQLSKKYDKTNLIEQILNNVKEKLPDFTKDKKNISVKRFHSFLRICYDNLFQGKWDKKILETPNMFNQKKPLIYQLGYAHLLHVLDTSNSLFNETKLIELNIQSLKFRKKIK